MDEFRHTNASFSSANDRLVVDHRRHHPQHPRERQRQPMARRRNGEEHLLKMWGKRQREQGVTDQGGGR
ncbi:hypothetical protein WJ970_02255 [Achromobacter xylosoxidans]